MKIACLGSGSKGNSLLVADERTLLMVDCGFALNETERRLARLGVQPSDITAILVTHEHGDHINGVGPLSRRYSLPVLMSQGSYLANRCGTIRALQFACSEQPVTFGRIRAFPFSVPHDAREPLQWVFDNGERRFALVTDVGHPTPFICEHIGACDAIMLECNHDEQMLRQGPYPPSLKVRVGGAYGHLNNDQSAALLRALDHRRLTQVIAAHLSEENNRPELAQRALAEVLNWPSDEIQVAHQQEGFDWLTIGGTDRPNKRSGEHHAETARVV